MLNKSNYQQLFSKASTTLDRVHWESPEAAKNLATALANQLKLLQKGKPGFISIVCIGTDRSTGDSLGPIIGTELSAARIPGLLVYGTLDEPVHAANLHEKINMIVTHNPDGVIIALDACLGKAESVGFITAKTGPLHPGTGVNKELPCIGDMHIIGTVNVGGFMEYLVLQNTRLSLVMNMARTICTALSMAIRSHFGIAEASVSQDI